MRQGSHVLRPGNEHSETIHQALAALRTAGFDGASNPIGIEPDGRERLDFIEGDVPLPPYPQWARADEALASVTVLMRNLHDASTGIDLGSGTWSTEMADPKRGPVLCHNDVCLENVVFKDGRAVALLDEGGIGPGIVGWEGSSVHDVERVSQGLIESSSRGFVKVPNRFAVEIVDWDRDDVVAVDDARFGESVLGAEVDF